MTDDTHTNTKIASVSADALPRAPGAAAILRGVQRLLTVHGFASVSEMPLANGRRADVLAIGPAGNIWIVEIKSSISDFRSDQKWPEYREYCDQLFFAVDPAFPSGIIPTNTGLIIADRYDGEIVREVPEQKLAGARRKMLTLQFARIAAARLTAVIDPG
jgi:hypothetical protein